MGFFCYEDHRGKNLIHKAEVTTQGLMAIHSHHTQKCVPPSAPELPKDMKPRLLTCGWDVCYLSWASCLGTLSGRLFVAGSAPGSPPHDSWAPWSCQAIHGDKLKSTTKILQVSKQRCRVVPSVRASTKQGREGKSYQVNGFSDDHWRTEI